jgi:endo-1,3-1,4-beta-glycanase ExoK
MINLVANPLIFTTAWRDDPPAVKKAKAAAAKQTPAKPAVDKPTPAPTPAPAPKAAAAPASNESGTLIKGNATLVQNMDKHDSRNWEMADWSNGRDYFESTFRPDNLVFQDGIMHIIVDNKGCPSACDDRPVASGELRTKKETFGYGDYEIRMKPAAGSGLMAGSLFTYRGVAGKPSHHEIDLEFKGDCRSLQTNYHVEGQGHHEEIFTLPFNACKEFHNYGFRWSKDLLAFYLDGKEFRRVEGEKLPYEQGKVIINAWSAGPKARGWLGTYHHSGRDSEALVDWVKVAPLPGSTQPVAAPAPQPAVEPKKATSTAPVKPLPIKNIDRGRFEFNGGKVSSDDSGTYTFSASQAKDPGFGILFIGQAKLEGRKTLKFEIKGSMKKDDKNGYARFIAQVYSKKDSDSSPSVSLDPVKLSKDWTEYTIDLEDITEVKKLQFLLLTSKGSCNVEIRNLRFE